MSALRKFAFSRFHYEPFIPGWRIPINVLIIVVQTKEVTLIHDPSRAVGEGLICAALGSRREDVRMLIVVPAMNPSPNREEHMVQPEVLLQVLRHLGGFIEGPVRSHGFLLRAVFVHATVQSAPQLDIGRSE